MAAAALPAKPPEFALFSKPLHGHSWRRLAQGAKQAGFTGIDLTTRPGGHVLPERVTEDLPRALAEIREEGLAVPMISTDLTSAADPAAGPTLAAAARAGIAFVKSGYYRYQFADVRAELRAAAAKFHGLAALAQKHAVTVGYHNHAGYVGASLWEVAELLDSLDPRWSGYYFDVCHATTEGGSAGWKIGWDLASRRLKMVALKDFVWEKRPGGGGRPRFCPLGEGMVDWKAFLGGLRRSGFAGPISLHLEYVTIGDYDNTLAAAQRDLAFLRRHWDAP
jgi:sugar phosphate isomerase/epimerase